MREQFGEGIKISGGTPHVPGMNFLASPSTGVFLSGKDSCGISSNGQTVAVFNHKLMHIMKNLRISDKAINNAVLTSDVNGYATWQLLNINGAFIWNTIYKSLDLTTTNNAIDIVFTNKLKALPSISLTKESDFPISDMDLYIKNKSVNGFTIYSSSPMTSQILSGDIGDYSVCKLTNGGIGVCYYNMATDRMEYTSSDSHHRKFSTPVIIEDVSAIGICDIALIGGNPAIVYIADDGSDDKWRYVRALDPSGITWGTSVTLASSSEDITFMSNTLFLRIVNGYPTVFFNNELGEAKVVKSADKNGSTWNTVLNIADLSNHQILDVKIIDGEAAIIAKSNDIERLYYTKSTNGVTWSPSIQLYKSNNIPLDINIGKCCNTIAVINEVVCIITSEAVTNNLYIAKANDKHGIQWGNYELLVTTNTNNTFPRVFKNNDDTYMLYNTYTGSPSKKNILKFNQDNTINKIDEFITTLPYCMDHQILLNNDDDNNTIILESENNLSLLKFYGDDFSVNWSAMS